MEFQNKGHIELSDGFVELTYIPALREWRVLRGFSEWMREPEIYHGTKKEMVLTLDEIARDNILDVI
uniref:Uncharacterized protein n=1 Tax=viral metagenome TaxID=1070528 RepID=A0A6M3Y2E6_9ZZZZ